MTRSSGPWRGIATTATRLDPAILTIIAPTAVEARALRRAAPGFNVVESGIGLSRVCGRPLGQVVVTCGLAGALRSDLPTGTVCVPDIVARPDGTQLRCDPEIVAALVSAARQLGQEPERRPLVTSNHLITGDVRRAWAERGFAAADMETGLVTAPRVAALRVVLDTPQREISEAWLWPARALVRPGAWGQLFWLMREGPRCARLAARVLAAALRSL